MEQSPVTSPHTALLSAQGIEAIYADRFHLGPIDLEIGAGEHYALLGPSGSGKSTLLRLLTGYLVPHAGTLTAFGRKQNLADQLLAGFAGIRYVWQDAALPAFQRIRDSLRRELAHLAPARQAERIAALAVRFAIEPYLETKAEELSLGQRQRCALALAFAARPALVALDEPFSHQDSWLRQRLLETTRLEAIETGATLILCTHNLEEASYLANQALYILDGQAFYQGELAGLKNLGIPEIKALYGWVSRYDGELVFLRECEEHTLECIPVQINACWNMPDYYLFKGSNPSNENLYVISETAYKIGDVIYADILRN